MRKQLLTIILLLFCDVLYSQTQQNILFIGNSLTYYNNMPSLFQNLALSKGKSINAQFYAPGGTGFSNHVNDANVYALFASRIWDFVVLQPGTGESVGASATSDSTIARGQRLIDSIKFYSPCAKVILYEISNGIASNKEAGGNYENYFATQTKIKDTLAKLSNGLHIPFAPAGECFRAYYTHNQDLRLHSSYGDVHPNVFGSYLVACAIFTTLYQDSVFGASAPENFAQELTTTLQSITDSVVLLHKPAWNINTYNLWTDFSLSLSGMSVHLENLSVNYDSVLWNINDEYSTNQLSVNYTFLSQGVKAITLSAYKDGCEQSVTKKIEVLQSNINSVKEISFKVYPNPVKDFLNIESANNGDIFFSLFDINGRQIIAQQKLYNGTIDCKALNVGSYILKLQQDSTKQELKILKRN